MVSEDKVELSAESTSSVDDVHNRLDSLMLSVFETVLAHTAIVPDGSNIETLRAEKVLKIRDNYTSVLAAIETLSGIDCKEEDQKRTLDAQSLEIAALKEKIVSFESQLLQRRRDIDVALNSVLSDQVLGLSGER
jgi:hypothetical protein